MLYDKMTEFVLKNELFTKDDKLGVALSGGADSVALVSCLKHEGYDFVALHVEHGLRAEESVADMRFVEALCEKLNVPLAIRRVNVKNEMLKGVFSRCGTKIRAKICRRSASY